MGGLYLIKVHEERKAHQPVVASHDTEIKPCHFSHPGSSSGPSTAKPSAASEPLLLLNSVSETLSTVSSLPSCLSPLTILSQEMP